MERYDIALFKKQEGEGFKLNEIHLLCNLINPQLNGKEEFFPLEIAGNTSTAIGYITAKAYESLDRDYESTGLQEFIVSILNDTELEKKLAVFSYGDRSGNVYNAYEFCGLKIWLKR